MKIVLLAASLLMASAGAGAANFLNEGFDDLATSGWTIVNASVPLGSSSWFQGNPATFPAFDGAPDSYAAADFNSTDPSGGTISTWLISPEFTFDPHELLAFVARASDAAFDDALNVMISTDGASLDLADFRLLLAINPGNATGGMPTDWTFFEARLGVPSGSGRIAFQYTVGPNEHAGYIGVDSVLSVLPLCLASPGASTGDHSSSETGLAPPTACPEPASLALVATALAMLLASGAARRRAFFAS